MFDIFFGWRKASKCKKLMRRLQCRLKLLKNKRCAIVKQLREDIAQLLRHGHEQSAFDRVEQLYKDETTVAIYDLLETFCEFIIINFPYIRKNKDCPNDINEAVSSLIYASARFGDLPELILIRKLFGERYGQRFANVALQLLPGNLVNRQIKEKLCMKSISEDVKFNLVDEIARSCFKSGPLLIEYHSEFQQPLANRSSGDQILSIEFPMNNDSNETDQNQANSSILETEVKNLYVDFSSESQKLIKYPGYSCQDSITAPDQRGTLASSETHTAGFINDDVNKIVDSSSENSDKLPKEMIYLDDIEEFESSVSKDGSFQDQRLFMFKPSEKMYNECFKEQFGSKDEKRGSRSFGSSKKISGKRLRKRSISLEKGSMTDKECAVYYGGSLESSPNPNHRPRNRRKHHKKVAIEETNRSNCIQGNADVKSCFINESSTLTFVERAHDDHLKSSCRCSFNGGKVSKCSLEHPCYFCTSEDTDDLKCSTSILKQSSARSLQEKIIECGSIDYKCSANKEQDSKETTQTEKVYQNPRKIINNHPPYTRATTMPPERFKDNSTEIVLRSHSFPVQQLESEASNRHIHPKLPDYDELAAKFIALKTAYQQSR